MTDTTRSPIRRGMARCDAPGLWQIGIYSVEQQRDGRWRATATGPGTIGDGYISTYPTLADAYLKLTGEPMPGARTATPPVEPGPASPASGDEVLSGSFGDVPADVLAREFPGLRREWDADRRCLRAFRGERCLATATRRRIYSTGPAFTISTADGAQFGTADSTLEARTVLRAAAQAFENRGCLPAWQVRKPAPAPVRMVPQVAQQQQAQAGHVPGSLTHYRSDRRYVLASVRACRAAGDVEAMRQEQDELRIMRLAFADVRADAAMVPQQVQQAQARDGRGPGNYGPGPYYVLMIDSGSPCPLMTEGHDLASCRRAVRWQEQGTARASEFAVTRYIPEAGHFLCQDTGRAYTVTERGIYTEKAFAEFLASLPKAGA